MGLHHGQANFITYGKPSLLLDFARNKSLVDRISGNNLITFERSSVGTYVGADGLIKTAAADEPRFDHDPETGESLGLLIEEQRTNIALNSEDFSTRSATNYGTKSSVTTNATIAPDGTQTADLVTTVTTTTQNRLGNLHSVTSGQYYTYSVYVKQGNKSNISLYLGYTSLINASMSFTFATETLSAGGSSYLSGSAGFDKLYNGWYRLYFTGQAFNSGNTYSGFISGTEADETFYIWGEQIEVGAFPTSYIPTSGSTLTRQPDKASITGSNFSSIYNSTEGTLYLEARGKGVGNTGSNATFQVDNGTSDNRITVINDDEAETSSLIAVGGSQTNFSHTPSFTAGVNKNIIAYKSGDNASSLNGSIVVTNTSIVTLPVVDRFRLGSNANGNSNNTIRRAIYYPTRLTNSQLQGLTE